MGGGGWGRVGVLGWGGGGGACPFRNYEIVLGSNFDLFKKLPDFTAKSSKFAMVSNLLAY